MAPQFRQLWWLMGLAIVFCSMGLLAGCRGGGTAQTPLERGIAAWFAEPEPPVKTSLFPLEVEQELDFILEQYINRRQLPGVVLALSSSQQTWLGAAGQANLDEQIDLQPTDRFRIGQLSELFLSVVCLQLIEEGILELEAPIVDWLPPAVAETIPKADQITLHQLLNHTSGLPNLDVALLEQAVTANPSYRWQAEELLNIGFERATSTSRKAHSYSLANYLLLELIIERATGSPLAEAIQGRIVTPLNLKQTSVELSSSTKLTVHGYQDWNGDEIPEDVTQPLLNTGLGLGGTALISNASDLTRFLQALFLGDSLLTEGSRQRMMTLVDGNRGSYGLGLLHSLTPWGEVWGQIGSTTGFSSAIFYLPVHDLTIVTWTNSGDRRVSNRPFELIDLTLSVVLENSSHPSYKAPARW